MKIRSYLSNFLVCIATIAGSPVAQGAPITYQFGWTASGEVAFTEAQFLVTFNADTANVQDLGNSAYRSGGLTGTLTGPFGITSTLSNRFVGITGSGFARSLGYGRGMFLDMHMGSETFTGFQNYDLQSAFGPMAGPEVVGMLLSDFAAGTNINIESSTARDFTFEARVSSSVPEPATNALLLAGLGLLGAMTRRKKANHFR